MSENLKAVIIDDERLARAELRSLLAVHGNITIAGEANSLDSGERVIRKTSPSVVFLDIQLAHENGFDLLNRVPMRFRPVFVTAYDRYAVRAFEANALDYLLKPVNPERLTITINRLSEALQGGCTRPPSPDEEDYIFLGDDRAPSFTRIGSIACIRAAGDYSELYTAGGNRYLVLCSMKNWEGRLPQQHFLRIHRSAIVNLRYVTKLENCFPGCYRVHVHNQEHPLPMSRRHALRLKTAFRLRAFEGADYRNRLQL
jgi:two-component system, LytTR family, response regulator